MRRGSSTSRASRIQRSRERGRGAKGGGRWVEGSGRPWRQPGAAQCRNPIPHNSRRGDDVFVISAGAAEMTKISSWSARTCPHNFAMQILIIEDEVKLAQYLQK